MNIQIEQLTYEQMEKKDFNNSCTGFIAPSYVTREIATKLSTSLFFKITIDGEVIECYYSPLGNDGNIKPYNTPYRILIKSLIPSFVYGKYIEKTTFGL